MKPLHRVTSLRIVAKRTHMPKVGILTARDVIHRLAASTTRTHEDELQIEDLERATGMPVAELAKLTDKWPPR